MRFAKGECIAGFRRGCERDTSGIPRDQLGSFCKFVAASGMGPRYRRFFPDDLGVEHFLELGNLLGLASFCILRGWRCGRPRCIRDKR